MARVMSDINKLRQDFPNVPQWKLESLIEIEKEEYFSMNKWYCWYTGIVSENYRYTPWRNKNFSLPKL